MLLTHGYVCIECTVDNHVPSSELNRLHCRSIVEQKSMGGKPGARPIVHPHRISLNKGIAESGLTHEPCPGPYLGFFCWGAEGEARVIKASTEGANLRLGFGGPPPENF
jgi:hypothetical protein